MYEGDEGQPGLQKATMDSFNNETPKNTENLFHKNFEYLLAQQQEAMLKQQQTFLTNLQSILISSRQTHSMGSSGPSEQGPMTCLQGPVGHLDNRPTACLLI